MPRKSKPKVEKKSLACSALSIEDELVFCPLMNMPVRIEAEACEICNWKDKKTEEKLYKLFMKRIK